MFFSQHCCVSLVYCAEDFRQAEEPKQRSVQTRRHNIGRTGQHTPHISFGAVLLSRSILLSCLVEIQSCQSRGLPTQQRYASNIRCAAYADVCWLILLLQLYVVGQPQTNCSVTSRPILTGLCMPMCLITRKNDL